MTHPVEFSGVTKLISLVELCTKVFKSHILIRFIKHRYDTAKMERSADQLHERLALSGRGGINA